MRVWKLGIVLALVGCGGASTGRDRVQGEEPEKADDGGGAEPKPGKGTGDGNGSAGLGGSLPLADPYGGGSGGSYGGSYSGGAGYYTGGNGGQYGLECVPLNNSSCELPAPEPLSEWQPRDLDLETPPAAQLLAARDAILGSWHGVAVTPWVPPYSVVLTFSADGNYSARCVKGSDYDDSSGGCCRAFYNGSDLDTPLKTWRLTDVQADGSAEGDVELVECMPDSCESGKPVYECSTFGRGTLDQVSFDASGDRMRFELWDREYGPVELDLERD